MHLPGDALRWPLFLLLVAVAGCASPSRESAVVFLDSGRPEQGALIEGVPDPVSPDMRAAAAVTAAAIGRWDPEASFSSVRKRMVDLTPAWGDVSAMGMVAQEYGMWAHAGRGTEEDIKSRLRAGAPVQVDLPVDERKKKWRRFALVVGFDEKARLYTCHEGRGRAIRYRYEGFARLWKLTGNWMMTICPPGRASWDLTADELVSRGRHYESAGDFENAEADLHRALALQPRNSAVYVTLANIKRRQGRLEEAERLYRRALGESPDDIRALNNLAFVLVERGGDLAEAERLARDAVIMEPTNPRTLHTMGIVMAAAGNHAKACTFLEQAWARSSRLARAERETIGLDLAVSCRARGESMRAAEVVADLLRKNPRLELPAAMQDLLPSPGR